METEYHLLYAASALQLELIDRRTDGGCLRRLADAARQASCGASCVNGAGYRLRTGAMSRGS